MSDSTPQSLATARSPMAGCTILIVALGVMVFLVVFSVFTLFRQYKEIVRFTDDQPRVVEMLPLEGRESEINALSERLELFRQQLEDGIEARLALSPSDLNLAVAAYDSFRELRRTFHIESIADGAMRIRISYPLNGVPRLSREGEQGFWTTDPRYLNGVMVARPVLDQGQIVLMLDDIEVDQAEVPGEFIQQMSPYRPTERYREHPTLGPAMARLTGLSVEEGLLVLRSRPGESAEAISEEQVSRGVSRFLLVFGGAASLFLLFVGIMIFLGIRAKAKSADA